MKPESVLIPFKNLDGIFVPITEQEDIFDERVHVQIILNNGTTSIRSLSQIGRSSLSQHSDKLDYPQSIFILIFSECIDIYSLFSQKDEDNMIYLKPQIRAISTSSSGHNGFSSLSRLPVSITVRIISTEGTA